MISPVNSELRLLYYHYHFVVGMKRVEEQEAWDERQTPGVLRKTPGVSLNTQRDCLSEGGGKEVKA
jgi:hypothetical protein